MEKFYKAEVTEVDEEQFIRNHYIYLALKREFNRVAHNKDQNHYLNAMRRTQQDLLINQQNIYIAQLEDRLKRLRNAVKE